MALFYRNNICRVTTHRPEEYGTVSNKVRNRTRKTSIDKLFRMLIALLRSDKLFLKPPEYNAHTSSM